MMPKKQLILKYFSAPDPFYQHFQPFLYRMIKLIGRNVSQIMQKFEKKRKVKNALPELSRGNVFVGFWLGVKTLVHIFASI